MLKCMNCKQDLIRGESIFRIERGSAYCEKCAQALFTIEEQRAMTCGYLLFDGVNKPTVSPLYAIDKIEYEETFDTHLNEYFEEQQDSCFWTNYEPECDDNDDEEN